jgi:tRNA(Arg) A34 adenosine deaminase TadA
VNPGIRAFRDALAALPVDEGAFPDERLGRETCAEAIDALAEGNYGVGCLLVDPSGAIVAQGHNEAFSPRFCSDRHAEMVVMNRFEDQHPEVRDMSKYVAHVSLEPCPMCLSRFIISGVGTVKFVAEDAGGGMTHHLDALPGNFRRLAAAQGFGLANCSPPLQKLAHDIFMSNLPELQARLRKRRASA